MIKIQANVSGSRSIDVNESHLATLRRYGLLEHLADSNGFIDESVLDKLRLHCRSILESYDEVDRDLMNLCLDVVYHPNMKALGLQNLVAAYKEWTSQQMAVSE